MQHYSLKIQQDEGPSKEGPKGRSFSGELLAHVIANGLWAGGSTDKSKVIRPVFAMVATTEGQAAPLFTNLRLGRKADLESNGYKSKKVLEILKGSDYAVTTQKHGKSVVGTFYLRELFLVDPGMVDPEKLRFILLPPKTSLIASDRSLQEHLVRLGLMTESNEELWGILGPLGTLFSVYVDRRTRAPLLSDPRFHAQLLWGMVQAGFASIGGEGRYRQPGVNADFGFLEENLENVGLAPGIAVSCSQSDFEKVLSEQVSLYYKVV